MELEICFSFRELHFTAALRDKENIMNQKFGSSALLVQCFPVSLWLK
jgi:hypothetical protein